MKIFYKIGGGFLVLGIVLFLVGFGLSGFNIGDAFTNSISYYEKHEYTYDNTVKNIQVKDKNTRVKIEKSTDDKIHVVCYTNDFETYEITQSNDLIIEKKTTPRKWPESLFQINFGSGDGLTVYIPKEFKGDIDARTSNSSISIDEVTVNSVEANTTNGSIITNDLNVNNLVCVTSNASINIKDVQSKNDVNVRTQNGKISIEDTKAVKSIIGKTSNGSVTLSSISADVVNLESSNGKISFQSIDVNKEVKLESSNGSIIGSVVGKASDYTIKSTTSNGKNNLPENMKIGDKSLIVNTSNGQINVEFEER